MADSLQTLLNIAQTVDEILEQHLQRSTIKRLFNINSDIRNLKKSQEKLQNLLEALRVASQVEATTAAPDNIEHWLALLHEAHDRGMLPSSAPQYASSTSGSSNVAPAQTIKGPVTDGTDPVVEHRFVSRSTLTYIQDNSVVVDGSAQLRVVQQHVDVNRSCSFYAAGSALLYTDNVLLFFKIHFSNFGSPQNCPVGYPRAPHDPIRFNGSALINSIIPSRSSVIADSLSTNSTLGRVAGVRI